MTQPPDSMEMIRRWVDSVRQAGMASADREDRRLENAVVSDPEILDALCDLLAAAESDHRGDERPAGASRRGADAGAEGLVEAITQALDAKLDALATRVIDGVAEALLHPLVSEVQNLAQCSQATEGQPNGLLDALRASRHADGREDGTEDEGRADSSAIAALLQFQGEGDGAETIRHLTHQLELARREIDDLKQQNEDLASQVAKHQVNETGHAANLSFDAESLSWEERKERILAQLEADDLLAQQEAEAGMPAEQRLEVQRIIDVTAREIARRDREIQELRTIVEEQSQTRGEVAIGAAAIAQMLDVDPLIEEERKKLRRIQEEWEEKLRQAEIDLSMERAKLARQRRELESEREELKSKLAALEAEATAPTGRRRRWLDHLGLHDDKDR